MLTPISYESRGHRIYWECLCDCGEVVLNVRTDYLLGNISKSCRTCKLDATKIRDKLQRVAKRLLDNQYMCYPDINALNDESSITMKCLTHNVYFEKPFSHLKSGSNKFCGCRDCDKANRKSRSLSLFLQKASEKYDNFYDYSNIGKDYTSTRSYIDIVCPVHGIFNMKAANHLAGHSCIKCAWFLTPEQFTDKMFVKHKDKYDYSKVIYEGSHQKVEIICPEHGPFWQSPASHYQGAGCRECSSEMQSYSFVDRYKIYEEVGQEIGTLYILEVTSEQERFLKVGISSKMNKRLNMYRRIKEYDFKVLREWRLTNLQTAIVEDRVLYTKKRNGMHYSPLHKFDGRFECVKYEFMKELVDMVEQEIEKAVENSKKVAESQQI